MNKIKKDKKEFYNKKARFEYLIEDSMEVGIVLTGDEIKAIRSGRVNMTTSYAKVINGEVMWLGGIINNTSGDPQRTRKLLLHKEQINKLIGKTQEKGYALVPIKLYIIRGKAKLELGIGKGKKKHDKREAIKKRDVERELAGKLKNNLK